jgi:hypothetical protein
MRKSRNKHFIPIFILAVFAIQLTISFNLSAISMDDDFLNQESSTLDYIKSELPQNLKPNDMISERVLNKDFSIFDENLKQELRLLPLDTQIKAKDQKVIMLFEENVTPEQRELIIKSTFEDFQIISNYDIISGIYMKINPFELRAKESTLNDLNGLRRIYKSETYESPFIVDNGIQMNALNDDLYPNWWLSAVGGEGLSYDGSGVRVAVIDTGIYNHPGLNIVANQNFVTDESSLNYNDDVGHGTHVAGIIGGDGTGSDGKYRGIAPGVSLINARGGNASGLEEGDIIDAIDWSSKPIGLGGADADIISMSFGGGFPYISDLLTQAISNAQKTYGVIFVASAGNDGPEYFTGSTPASGIDVISVGATDDNGELASFSSWGPTFGYVGYPDVSAPGVDIISTEAAGSTISKEMRYIGNYFDFNGDADYIPLSGTSMAAPVVSGALAILKEAYPNITPETGRIALIEGSNKLLNEDDKDFVKSGAGLINISASLDYLNSISPDYNDTASVYPDNLPIEPFDLLRFPGDHQKFNLTVISGQNNNFTLEVPNNVQGISINLDKYNINFSNSGVKFIELDIKVNKDAFPGARQIQINLTSGGIIYDVVDISLDINLPEYNVLMESYHGLNDWFPEISFYQMGFYEAMDDISNMNISLDYGAEYWTPDYNKNEDNSILTEEKLAKYDLIILQAPILPYSPSEITNIKTYFENGGNILFLGTRYQDMAVENLNHLFSSLEVGIHINEENIMNDNWFGFTTSVSSQSVQNFSDQIIFNGINRFLWRYGNSFTVSNDGESIANLDNKTVVAKYNGSSFGKGQLLAFGDLHWFYNEYKSSTYRQDHNALLGNILDFLLPKEDAAINIDINPEYTFNSQVDISIYLKNQTLDTPITNTDYDTLELNIKNDSYSQLINLNMTYSSSGIYFNNTFNLPSTSNTPYSVILNLTIGSTIYSKSAKILYFDASKVPIISSLISSDSAITRAVSQNTILNAELDKSSYSSFNGYLSIYSWSFNNIKKSVNKSLTFNNIGGNNYRNIFDPSTSDPSGYGIFFIEPTNENYTNPKSPRIIFQIINNPPEIIDTSSSFQIDGSNEILFDDVESETGVLVYSASQGSKIDFFVDLRDSVSYEDDNSNMRVFVNLIMVSVTDDNFIIFIFPASFVVSEILYNPLSDLHEGYFIIPSTLNYYSIDGIKPVTTAPGFDFSTNEGYLGVLYITAYDREGSYDDFIIILAISGRTLDASLAIFITLGIVALIGIAGAALYFSRKKRVRPIQDYYYQPSYESQENQYIKPEPTTQISTSMYCPFCGGAIVTPKKFCPHCGESLNFEEQEG